LNAVDSLFVLTSAPLVWLFEHLLFPENVILDAPTMKYLSSWFEWFHVGVKKLSSLIRAALVYFFSNNWLSLI
jgi:hypothetical protein